MLVRCVQIGVFFSMVGARDIHFGTTEEYIEWKFNFGIYRWLQAFTISDDFRFVSKMAITRGCFVDCRQQQWILTYLVEIQFKKFC